VKNLQQGANEKVAMTNERQQLLSDVQDMQKKLDAQRRLHDAEMSGLRAELAACHTSERETAAKSSERVQSAAAKERELRDAVERERQVCLASSHRCAMV
jgi:hypothetical protein